MARTSGLALRLVEIAMTSAGPVAVEVTAVHLGEAWIRVTMRLQVERRGVMDQIAAANAEIYVSPDERAEKVDELHAKKRRLDDDLIALGQIHTEAIRVIAEIAQSAAEQAAKE
jgi:hypothetical protein